MATRRIDNDDLVVFLDELIDSLFRNRHRICLCVGTVEGNPQFGGILLELVEGSGTGKTQTKMTTRKEQKHLLEEIRNTHPAEIFLGAMRCDAMSIDR